METLLLAPDESIKGIRDRAILEVLYATGIRVSEIIELRLKDINLRMGFLTLNGAHGRARIVPDLMSSVGFSFIIPFLIKNL